MHSALYFPILRAKPGEINAVAHLSPLARTRIRPIFDIPLLRINDKRSLKQYLAETIRGIGVAWGNEYPLFIDLSRYAPDIDIGDGRHPVEYVFDCARQVRLQAIPVAGPESIRGPGPRYLQAVTSISNRNQLGVGVRIPFEDFLSPEKLLKTVEDTLRSTGLSAHELDLLLDAEALERHPPAAISESALLKTIQAVAVGLSNYRFRTLIFCGSSIPERVGPEYEVEPFRTDRVELRVWRKLLSYTFCQIIPFGDYGIVTPFQADANIPVPPPSRIRLSMNSEHVLYRASRENHRQLCAKVMETPEAYLQAPSWGMDATRACGAGYGGTGGPSEWVARDTNAHIETTVRTIDHQLRTSHRITDLSFPEPVRVPWLQDVLEVT